MNNQKTSPETTGAPWSNIQEGLGFRAAFPAVLFHRGRQEPPPIPMSVSTDVRSVEQGDPVYSYTITTPRIELLPVPEHLEAEVTQRIREQMERDVFASIGLSPDVLGFPRL